MRAKRLLVPADVTPESEDGDDENGCFSLSLRDRMEEDSTLAR